MGISDLNLLARNRNEPEVVRFGFVLLPEFPLYALVPAIEALRIANQYNGKNIYDWLLISESDESVLSASGVSLSVGATLRDVDWLPIVFVFAANHPTQHMSKKLLNWLRRLARHGSVIGSIDTGAFALAEAGLLQGRRVTLHWESISTFRECYPEIEVTDRLYEIDHDRVTCAGGHATLDLVVDIIERLNGSSLAQMVTNAFVAHREPGGDRPQRLETQSRPLAARSPLAQILQDMEDNIRTPLSAQDLADRAGVSVRALNRLVRDRVGEAPMSYYRKIRLQAARNTLFYSDIAIQDVATACGFGSPEVFSRSFKAHFGISPREYRRRATSEELRRFRPELQQRISL